jgi:hypothetical protein
LHPHAFPARRNLRRNFSQITDQEMAFARPPAAAELQSAKASKNIEFYKSGLPLFDQTGFKTTQKASQLP